MLTLTTSRGCLLSWEQQLSATIFPVATNFSVTSETVPFADQIDVPDNIFGLLIKPSMILNKRDTRVNPAGTRSCCAVVAKLMKIMHFQNQNQFGVWNFSSYFAGRSWQKLGEHTDKIRALLGSDGLYSTHTGTSLTMYRPSCGCFPERFPGSNPWIDIKHNYEHLTNVAVQFCSLNNCSPFFPLSGFLMAGVPRQIKC